jgi:IS605 OrfB family transposase
MIKTYQFRIYPNKNPEVKLNRTLTTCRKLYNDSLAKSISDAGWYQLMQFTKTKAECAGKIVEFVNPAGTSQTCLSAKLIEVRTPISTVGTTGIYARQGLSSRKPMQRDAQALYGCVVHYTFVSRKMANFASTHQILSIS